jgi:hypothetical protein
MKEPAVPNLPPPPSGERTLVELPGWFLGVFSRMNDLDAQISELERKRARLRAEFGHLSMEIGCYLANELPDTATYFPQSWVKRGPTTVEIVPPLIIEAGPDLFDADLLARIGVPPDMVTQFITTRRKMQENTDEIG